MMTINKAKKIEIRTNLFLVRHSKTRIEMAKNNSKKLNFLKRAIPSSPALKKSLITENTVGTTTKSMIDVVPHQRPKRRKAILLVIIEA